MKESPLAFSYIRFSTPEQMQGDSLRRQVAAAEAYCQRNGLTMDTSLSLRDLGVSAFKGRHRDDKSALGQFLRLAQEGRIPKGSCLVIENLDRLSREDERTALRLWLDILDCGITIVQLTPETVFKHERSDMFDIMRAIMELSRAHHESTRKSGLISASWQARHKKAAEKPVTGKGPFWLALEDGTFRVKEDRAAVVRRMFRMCREGQGCRAIAKALNGEEIPSPYGRVWATSSVRAVLMSRAVLGEYTPHTGMGAKRKPCGPAVPDYYPAVIKLAEFDAAQAALKGRACQRGPRGKDVANLFAELLHDARDGTRMHVMTKSRAHRYLVSSGAAYGQKGCVYRSIPYPAVEEGLLRMLREVDAEEIQGCSELDALRGLEADLAARDARIAQLELALAGRDIAAVARQLGREEDARRELAARLEAERRRAAGGGSALGEVQSLAHALKKAKDVEGARLRLRAAIARVVESVHVLVVPLGHLKSPDRLCAVQMRFRGRMEPRDYLLFWSARAGRAGRGWVRSLCLTPGDAGLDGLAGFDLRRRDHAARLEDGLQRLHPGDLEAEAIPLLLFSLGHKARLARPGEVEGKRLVPGPQSGARAMADGNRAASASVLTPQEAEEEEGRRLAGEWLERLLVDGMSARIPTVA